MKIPQFTGDEDKDEINHMEWLRLVNEYDMTPLITKKHFFLVKLRSGGRVLIRILDGTSHEKHLKSSSQNIESRIQKWRRCIQFKMS
jgi:hypothetical protein